MNKIIGILAHVDAGKTTFSEQLLFHSHTIKQRGRVDHQNAFLDSHTIEKQRGITVFADQAIFQHNDSTYYLIDTPGHVDFSSEMNRAIQMMDYAIIVVSAVEGVEAHTETVWQLLQEQHIPTFFFINKIDRVGANVEDVQKEIKKYLTPQLCYLNNELVNESMSTELIEFIAERDEQLLDYYMEHGYEYSLWLKTLQKLIKNGELFPCMSGSALQDIGIQEFMKAFDALTYTTYESNKGIAGKVYKVRYEESGTRVTFLKLYSGKFFVRDELQYGADRMEKITQIRVYNGNSYQQVQEANAGEIVAVTGLSNAQAGDQFGQMSSAMEYKELIPTLRSEAVFEPHMNMKDALRIFRMLETEDPALQIVWEEKLQRIQLHVMGAIQLEVLTQVLWERFALQVQFNKPEILYKETIAEPVMGYGHFEPLRHYAEVHLLMEPAPRNTGIQFSSVCHVDELAVSGQQLIGQHVLEREHHGVLTGFSLTDMHITLLHGRDHSKHTHGGDFREATHRAIRQGLEKVRSVLLEPFYQFKIVADQEHMGRIITDIQKYAGSFETPELVEEKITIIGKAPVATLLDYQSTLASFTGGRGRIQLSFAGYFPCHNEQEVIAKIMYDKDADPEYTSSSIFCAKGAGYSVKWDEAEELMHIPKHKYNNMKDMTNH